MRIGLDARMLGPQQGGLGRYVEQLVWQLMALDRETEYILFLRKENYNYARTYDEKSRDDLVVLRDRDEQTNCKQNNFRKVLADIPWYGCEEQIKLKSIIKKEKVDLMHFPHWNVPFRYNDSFIVTIHDLIMYHYPRAEASTLGAVSYWFKDKASRLIVQHALTKSKHILVTSEFTKQDVHETLGVPLEKMTVTYQAPFELKPNLKFLSGLNVEKTQKSILDKYKITKPFILYVGVAFPHKNLEGLLRAWKIFEEKYGNGYQLVLVGRRNFFYQKLLNHVTMKQYNNVIYTDFVADDSLSVIYDSASLYVFPSLYEGFGIPPLEAISHGVPVASSNRSCLPEVLGEAALYFDPENYEQMADTMYLGLTNEEIRYELKQRGREELKRYSWEKLAERTIEIYMCFGKLTRPKK